MTTLTKDTAVDKLMHISQVDLAEMCYYMHKDQYNVKGHHFLNNPVPDLVSWIITHYTYNEQEQCWESIVPFDNY